MPQTSDSPAAGRKRMHPHLQQLIAHFAEASVNRGLPPASAFHAEELDWLDGCFCTVEVLTKEKDYRFGPCGAYMRLFYGHDMAGRRLGEAETCGHLSDLKRDFDHVVLARRPRYSRGNIVWDSGVSLASEWLIMPFSVPRGHVSMLLVAEKTNPLPRDFSLIHTAPLPRLETRTLIWPAFSVVRDRSATTLRHN